MRWVTVERSIFSKPEIYAALFVDIIAIALLYFVHFTSGTHLNPVKAIPFFIGLVFGPLLTLYFLKSIRPIKVGFDESLLIVVYRDRVSEVPYDNIDFILTWGKKNQLTFVKLKSRGGVDLGFGTAGDLGLSIAEAFKNYMEKKGCSIRVEKKYFGDVMKDYRYKYIVESRTEGN